MSDTPLTDCECGVGVDGCTNITKVDAEFARQLELRMHRAETKRDYLSLDRDRVMLANAKLVNTRDRLRAELHEARECLRIALLYYKAEITAPFSDSERWEKAANARGEG